MTTYVLMRAGGAVNPSGFYLYSSTEPEDVSSSNSLKGLASICSDIDVGKKDKVATLSTPINHVGVRMMPVSVSELMEFVGAVSEARKAKSSQ